MDSLDHVAEPARELLGRVDGALVAYGAPDDHPIWALLRRLGALPGDAFAWMCDARPSPMADVAARLAACADGYRREHDSLDDPSRSGVDEAPAATVDAHWAATVAHLADGPDSLAERLAATGDYLLVVIDWLARSRDEMATAVAGALGSAEAVALSVDRAEHPAGQREAARAAADIGARVLAAAAVAYDRGVSLGDQWHDRLVELAYEQPAAGAAVDGGGTIRVRL